MKKNPEKLSSILRRVWGIASALCAIAALLHIAFIGDPERTIALTASGIAFWLMSQWRHDGLDF